MRLPRLRWQLFWPSLFYGCFIKKSRSQKKYSRRSLWLLPFVGMAGNTLFSLILNMVHLTEHFSNASQEALFQSNLLVQIIGIGLFVPFVEELVFRGLVYGKMRRLFSFRAAAAVSAALFCPLSWKHRSAGLCLSHGTSSGLVLRTLGKSFRAGAPSHRSQSSWDSGDGDQGFFDSVMCSMP